MFVSSYKVNRDYFLDYSTAQYTPRTIVNTSTGEHISVPLIVVKRGVPAPAEAAVSVKYGPDVFYIPRPALGTYTEARSLQVLDFVTQVIAAQTSSKQLPTVNTLGVVVSR